MDCKHYALSINGKDADVQLNLSQIIISEVLQEDLDVDDIIAIQLLPTSSSGSSQHSSCILHYIKRHQNLTWTKETLSLTPASDRTDFERFVEDLNSKHETVKEKRPKRLLVAVNPVGGSGRGEKTFDKVVRPLFELAGITHELVVSKRYKHFTEVFKEYDFKDHDGVVFMGGDGSFHEIADTLIKKVQEEAGIDINDASAELKPLPKPIGIIPTGTGNGGAESATGCRDVVTSVLHIIKGNTRYAGMLACYCDNKLSGFAGCLFGTLAMAVMFDFIDRRLRWLGLLRHLVGLYYFFKPTHIVPIEITVYSRNPSGEVVETDMVVEDVITQDCFFMMVSPWEFTEKDGKIKPSNNGKLSGAFFKPMSKWAFFRNLSRFITRSASAFDPPEITKLSGHAFRIKLLGPPDPRIMLSLLDGEVYDNPKPEHYIRMVDKVVKVYSSYS